MLGVLRKHAGSWLIKTTLALIILSFALFFGYTRFADKEISGKTVIASVGGKPILKQTYDAYFDDQMERMRGSLKGEIPQGIEEFLKNQVLEQLVSTEVASQYAKELGLRIPDTTLAIFIQEIPSFKTDGVFDPGLYRQNRVYHLQRFGTDLEETIRKELLRERLNRLAGLCFGPWQEELTKSLEEMQPKKAKKKKKKELSEPPALQTASPSLLLTQWMTQFRDQTTIKLYRNPS